MVGSWCSTDDEVSSVSTLGDAEDSLYVTANEIVVPAKAVDHKKYKVHYAVISDDKAKSMAVYVRRHLATALAPRRDNPIVDCIDANRHTLEGEAARVNLSIMKDILSKKQATAAALLYHHDKNLFSRVVDETLALSETERLQFSVNKGKLKSELDRVVLETSQVKQKVQESADAAATDLKEKHVATLKPVDEEMEALANIISSSSLTGETDEVKEERAAQKVEASAELEKLKSKRSDLCAEHDANLAKIDAEWVEACTKLDAQATSAHQAYEEAMTSLDNQEDLTVETRKQSEEYRTARETRMLHACKELSQKQTKTIAKLGGQKGTDAAAVAKLLKYKSFMIQDVWLEVQQTNDNEALTALEFYASCKGHGRGEVAVEVTQMIREERTFQTTLASMSDSEERGQAILSRNSSATAFQVAYGFHSSTLSILETMIERYGTTNEEDLYEGIGDLHKIKHQIGQRPNVTFQLIDERWNQLVLAAQSLGEPDLHCNQLHKINAAIAAMSPSVHDIQHRDPVHRHIAAEHGRIIREHKATVKAGASSMKPAARYTSLQSQFNDAYKTGTLASSAGMVLKRWTKHDRRDVAARAEEVKGPNKSKNPRNKKRKTSEVAAAAAQQACPKCLGNHRIQQCPNDWVDVGSGCFACGEKDHQWKDCHLDRETKTKYSKERRDSLRNGKAKSGRTQPKDVAAMVDSIDKMTWEEKEEVLNRLNHKLPSEADDESGQNDESSRYSSEYGDDE